MNKYYDFDGIGKFGVYTRVSFYKNPNYDVSAYTISLLSPLPLPQVDAASDWSTVARLTPHFRYTQFLDSTGIALSSGIIWATYKNYWTVVMTEWPFQSLLLVLWKILTGASRDVYDDHCRVDLPFPSQSQWRHRDIVTSRAPVDAVAAVEAHVPAVHGSREQSAPRRCLQSTQHHDETVHVQQSFAILAVAPCSVAPLLRCSLHRGASIPAHSEIENLLLTIGLHINARRSATKLECAYNYNKYIVCEHMSKISVRPSA